jgi:hypothetical protein
MEHYYLAKYAYFCTANNKGVAGIGSRQLVTDDLETWGIALQIASFLLDNEGASFADIQSHIEKISKDEIERGLSFLYDANLLFYEKHLSDDRYSRNKLYYRSKGLDTNKIQDRLSKSSVAILGCGGIGNIVSVMLATSGVGNIYLIDADIVELSNLTRQFMFSECDVGEYKVTSLSRELRKRNSEINVYEINKIVSSYDDLDIIKHVDVAVLSADSPANISLIVNKYCVSNSIPFIHVGYLNDISVVGPFFIPGLSGCINCGIMNNNINETSVDSIKSSMMKKINSKCKGVSFPIQNEISASIAANDIIKFLGKYGTPDSANKKIGFSPDGLQLSFLDYSVNSSCEICSKKQR